MRSERGIIHIIEGERSEKERERGRKREREREGGGMKGERISYLGD